MCLVPADKFFFTMRGARIGNRTEPPLPVLMALIINSGSTPAFKASATASPIAAVFTVTGDC